MRSSSNRWTLGCCCGCSGRTSGLLPFGWLPLDLVRLPSGKFDTNHLVCELAALAMNILRLIGQRGLLGRDSGGVPVRHAAKRRQLKTVTQALIYRAVRLIHSGRQLILGARQVSARVAAVPRGRRRRWSP